MNIGLKQEQLISYTKSFLNKIESSNIDSSLSSFCYLTPWAETPGYAKLKLWTNGWKFSFKYLIILLKNIFIIASHSNYTVVSKSKKKEDYNVLFLSWCFEKNFLSDGSLQDRYFLENSKDIPRSHWLLVSMDGYVPANLNNNVTIIKRRGGIFKYNFFSFIQVIISTIFKYKFSPRKIFHYLYYHSHLARQISLIVKDELKKNNYKLFVMPYEAQPFQQRSFLEAKKINQNITTIGYLHTLLTPNPCDFVYRTGSPDILLAHGQSQIDILESKLNWPKEKLLLTESFRYRLDEKRSLSKKIFTPYTIHNSYIFVREFEKLIKESQKNFFPNFSIKLHPAMSWLQQIKHLRFEKKLQNIISTYKDRFSGNPTNKNISIFFGVTAAVFEALETGIDVIHICSDPVFDSHSERLWPNLKVEQLSKYVFRYTLISIGKYIIFGKKENFLNKTLKKFVLTNS